MDPRPRRHALLIVITWLIAIASLSALGSGISGHLAPMSLEVPGTPSARAEAMLRARFGNTIPIAILLRGPAAQVSAQGQRLASALRRQGGVEVLSPWDQTHSAQVLHTTLSALRPHPDAAFLLVDYERPPSAAMAVAPEAEAVVRHVVREPVHSYLTGIAVIGQAIQAETLKDTAQAEMIALPVLIVVLLLVFRSPLAALVPLMMGAATVGAGRGLLWIASLLTPINSLSVAIAAMMSLALGVDYALLMVSRVRQELRDGRDYAQAVSVARRAAGRTIAAAGGTLALTMLAASLVATPGLLGPVAIGVVISGLLSVALALSAMPSVLLLLGPSLNRWEIRLPRRGSNTRHGRIRALADGLISRPAITAPVILLAMLALAEPALALRMGPPDASELPSSSPARQAVRMVEETIGPGWAAPFVVLASAREGAITTQERLHALMHWQQQVASLPDVAAVLGPGSVAGASATLAQAHAALLSAPKRLDGAQRGIAGLRGGLRRADGGVQRLRDGLEAAAAGARSLSGGAAEADAGGQKLAAETGRAHEGSQTLAAEAGRADRGSEKLTAESGRADRGAKKLARETGKADEGAGALADGLNEASAGSQRLASGLDEAAAGAERLASGDSELSAGAKQLASGMDALDETVHTALAPIEAIAAHLHEWASWLESLQLSSEQLKQRLAHATQALQSIPVSHQNPGYETLSADIAAISEEIERNGLSELGHIQQLLSSGLTALSALPAELSRLTESLDQLRAGADRLASGASESAEGAQALSTDLHQLAAGGHELSNGLSVLSGGAGALATGLTRLHDGNETLADGLGSLHNGNQRLANGLSRLKNGNQRLAGGLSSLQGGDERLAGGLSRLQGGDERLASGLSSAGAQTETLIGGLRAAQHPLRTYETMLAAYQRDYALLHSDSPRALDSGYLVLTALDGTVSPMREQVAQMVNVDAGGQAMRMIVVASSGPTSAATAALSKRLSEKLPALAAATGASVQIGQGAEYLLNYKEANTARLPWLIFALALVATFTLIVVLRALLLPLIAVLLNLATIFVALGVLVLLTHEHMLGGARYIDAASGAGIISIMFVLSIDYEVFLLTRMREHWSQHHDANAAITHGLRHTASVITGSAAIMTGVFLAFAGAAVVPLRQFGVGLTIAVLLDAAIVRLVLLPAIMRLLGARVWWLPRWLARALPTIE